MNGLQTLVALRARPDVAQRPVAFLTAETDAEHIQAPRDAGAVAIMAKPFDPMGLGADVRKLYAGL